MERYTSELRILITKTYLKYLESLLEKQDAPNCSIEETDGEILWNWLGCEREITRLSSVRTVHWKYCLNNYRCWCECSHIYSSPFAATSHLDKQFAKDYKVQLIQAFKPQHRTFVNWVLENQGMDADFVKKIIFGDEAHFRLNGYVSTQNSRIWEADTPHVDHEKAMYPQRITVWWGFSAGEMVEPYLSSQYEFLWLALVGMHLDKEQTLLPPDACSIYRWKCHGITVLKS